MNTHRLLKVQTPALRLGAWRFGAHTFVAHQDDAGRIVRELHGIARGPGGAQLPFLGGVAPFRREFVWGESWPGQSGFYDASHPQAVLLEGSFSTIAEKLRVAEAVRSAVNAARLRYPWPAARAGNSNSYYATLLAGMGLADVRMAGELWAPGASRRLLPDAALAALAEPLSLAA